MLRDGNENDETWTSATPKTLVNATIIGGAKKSEILLEKIGKYVTTQHPYRKLLVNKA